MTDALTLSQILSRGVSLEWQEGVAVVRGVMECLTSRDLTNRGSDLDQIRILSSGGVEITGASKVADPVRHLGQLLHVLVRNSNPPAQLRLVISQAIAPSPLFESLSECAQALEYFERPDRAAVLQALFARAIELPEAEGLPEPTLDAVAPLSPTPVPGATATRSNRRVAGLAAAAALMAGAIAWMEYQRTSSAAGLHTSDVADVAQRVSETVGSTTLSGLSAITQRVGLGRLVPQNAESTSVQAPATPVSAAHAPSTTIPTNSAATPTRTASVEPPSMRAEMTERNVPASVPAQTPAAARTVRTFEAPPAPTSNGDLVQVLAFDLGPVSLTERAASNSSDSLSGPPALSGAITGSIPDTTIYSVESVGVDPPIAIRPQLPTELPANVRQESLIEVELIISVAGSVDSVRLRGSPRHMYDGMWLSAIKAWQFQPASKSGSAVRYRKTVWIAALR
jgi:hypothetical protein